MACRPTIAAALLSAVAALAGCSREAREERLAARADADFAAGKYDRAEVEYGAALELAPDLRATGNLGILYSDEGRTLQAYPYLKRAADEGPERADVRVKLGLALLEFGGANGARESAKRALAADPANEEALLLLGASSQTRGEAEDTRRLVDGLRRTHPDCSGYHLVLGRLLLAAGRKAEAETEVRAALALDPKSAGAHFVLGNLLTLDRDEAGAGEEFRAAAQLAPLRSSLRLRYVDFLLGTGRNDEARNELMEINRKAPDYIPGLNYSVKVAKADHRYPDCEALIQKILLRDPRNFLALMDRGEVRLDEGDPPGAVDELRKAEYAYADSPQVKYELGLAYLANGELAKAEDRLNQAIVIAPGLDQAKLVLAEVQLRQGNAAPAVVALDGLIQRHPQSARAYLLLARGYVALNNPEQALATYLRMSAVYPKDPQVPYLVGVLQSRGNRRAEARVAFNEAVKLVPDYWPALDMLVDADLSEGRIDAAQSRVNTLREKYPKLANPWLLQAKVDLVRKDSAATEADLLKAIAFDPRDQTGYFELAQVYISQRKTQQAVDKLSALVDRAPSSMALMQLGILHTVLGKNDAARADYERLLSSDPKFEPALNNLAYLYSEQLGQPDLAYNLAKRARDENPDDAKAADTLGWVLFRRGDYAGAFDLVLECTQREPENSAAQYHLGMIYYMMGEEDSARQAFQRVLGGSGVDVEASSLEDARRRLALLAIDPEGTDRTALSGLQARLGEEPNSPVVLTRLAALEARGGDAAGAAAHYETALRFSPRNTRTMLHLAELYAGPLGDPEKARALAKSAHELAPDDGRISETLGRLLFRIGDYEWSMDLLQEATVSISDDPELRFDLALAEYNAGRVSTAEDTVNEVLSGGMGFTRRVEAGRLAAMIAAGKSMGAAEAARAQAGKLLAEDSSYLPAEMVAALALEQEGNTSAAAGAYEKILAQDPYFSPATRQLALIYLGVPDKSQRAFELASKARVDFPDDPVVAKALGILDYRLRDYPGAINLLQESLGKRDGDAETAFVLGMAHLQNKDLAEARAELQRALNLNLEGPEAEQARKILALLK